MLGDPMARRIVEASSRSAWQAEPVEAITCGQASSRARPDTPGKQHVQRVGQPGIRMSGQFNLRNVALQPDEQVARQRFEAHRVAVAQPVRGETAGATQADDGRDVLGAGAAPGFLTRAAQHGVRAHAAPDVEGADALWRVSLWPAIDNRSTPSAFTSTAILPIACAASTCINAPCSRAGCGDLRDWLHYAGFVLRVDQRDEARAIADRAPGGGNIHAAVAPTAMR